MNTFEDVVNAAKELITSAWALAALTASFESGFLEFLTEPRTAQDLSDKSGISLELQKSLLGVLVALRFVARENGTYRCSPGMQQCLISGNYEWILAKLRSAHLQTHSLVQDAKHGNLHSGWRHKDPEILRSQGRLSSTEMVMMFENRILPRLDDLDSRLTKSSAVFLDVGTGVGCLALAMTARWPCLRVVAMEPFGPSLVEAKRNLADSPLSSRIELRAAGLEELTDDRAFDLIWLPQMFVPEELFRQGLKSVWRALRPGGWVWMPALNETGTAVRQATGRLRNVVWGGAPIGAPELMDLLRASGFTKVQKIENTPMGEHVFVVSQRLPNSGHYQSVHGPVVGLKAR